MTKPLKWIMGILIMSFIVWVTPDFTKQKSNEQVEFEKEMNVPYARDFQIDFIGDSIRIWDVDKYVGEVAIPKQLDSILLNHNLKQNRK